MSMSDRIRSFSEIPTGWLGDGEGERIAAAAIEAALLLVPHLERASVGVFPTFNGGILFEDDGSSRSKWFTVDVHADGHVQMFFFAEDGTDHEVDGFDAARIDAWLNGVAA